MMIINAFSFLSFFNRDDSPDLFSPDIESVAQVLICSNYTCNRCHFCQQIAAYKETNSGVHWYPWNTFNFLTANNSENTTQRASGDARLFVFLNEAMKPITTLHPKINLSSYDCNVKQVHYILYIFSISRSHLNHYHYLNTIHRNIKYLWIDG